MQYVCLILVLFFNGLVHAHGFGGSTFITIDETGKRSIESICQQSLRNAVVVASYHVAQKYWTAKRIAGAGTSESNSYYCLGFDNSFNETFSNDVFCTPVQKFYVPQKGGWVAAHQLDIGDDLLAKNGTCIPIVCLHYVKKPLRVYMIDIEDTHTFFVGWHEILTHNMHFEPTLNVIRCMASLPVSMVSGGCFGPLGAATSLVVSGLLIAATEFFLSKRIRHYKLPCFNINAYTSKTFLKNNNIPTVFAADNKDEKDNDAQAPGKPTEKDGFVPKKNWNGQKVNHRRGWGWPDQKGNIWIPTGPNGHGGPHWDVQKPNGDYENVVPGGRKRGLK